MSSNTGVLKVSLIIELISNGHSTIQFNDSLYKRWCMQATVEKVLPQEFCSVTTEHQKQSNQLVTEPRALPAR